MRIVSDPAWRQEEEPDWPTQAEMDAWAEEMTEEAWEAEQGRIRDRCYGPLPVHLRRQATELEGEAA
jgi:hypothetical protein